ncbi:MULTISPECIES: DUF3105 domain-containing protein [Actinomadura]|uniref:DUF3105 domain-containing protein n=1 Tax=Actinomadura yumaensis TaxID=111807 RepID=A0ABW2CN48_9ACTN|nr:DUF3105 domain-containing protein [Actinomadura sp. J1-007]MWK39052.1 DUF3105 domain-containing protein [Actinomadura sp. J1-007]
MSKSARNARAGKARPNALTERQVPWGGIAFFAVIGVVAIVAISYAFLQTRPSSASGSGSGSADIAGLVEKNGLSRDHTTGPVKYDTSPPMGGAHDPMWQNCDARVYDRQLRNENAVHSLEHGAVWVAYRPDLPAAQVKALKDKVSATDYSLMSPYPGLDAPVVLTAWGKQLKLQNASDQRVDAFLRAFVKGPQTQEPGAACDGAKDTP